MKQLKYKKGHRKRQGNYCLRELKDDNLSASHAECENCKWLFSCPDLTVLQIAKKYYCVICGYQIKEENAIWIEGRFLHKDCKEDFKKRNK